MWTCFHLKYIHGATVVFDQERKIKKARIDATKQLGHGATGQIEITKGVLTSTTSSLKGFGNAVAKEVNVSFHSVHWHIINISLTFLSD